MISTPKAILYDANGNVLVGQKTTAESIPVTMASDQPPVSVMFTDTNAFTGVSLSIRTLGGATANTLIKMEATTYTEPAAQAQRSFSSANAADTAAGTGARTIRYVYFTNAGAGPFTEDVTLLGATPVNTVATDIRFVECFFVLTAGSGGANAGVITMFNAAAGGGGPLGTLGTGNILTGVGDNTTLWAHHYTPINTEIQLATLVVSAQSGGSGTSARFFLRSASPLIANSAEVLVNDVILSSGAFSRSFDFHTRITGFSRITGYAIPGVNNATVTLAFDWSELPT
jgi:hypothetical protein